MRSLVVLLMIATAACVAPGRGPSDTSVGADGRDRLQGVVRLVGSAPVNVRIVIQNDDGSTVLAGPLTGELRRLTGAEVVAFGRAEGASFIADDYRIVAIDGRPVTMGLVEGLSGDYVQLRTPEGELVYVAGAAGQFRTGEKVWVQGPPGVIAQTYGTLHP